MSNYEKRIYAAGLACFTAYGDKFWIRDLAADGLHVEMHAQDLQSGKGYRCYSFAPASVNSWFVCGFANELPEGHSIAYTASLYNGSTSKSVGSQAFAFTS